MTTTNPTDAQMKLADVTQADVTAALPTESELKLARKCTARANFLLEKKTLQSILNGEQDTWPEVVASILAIRATEARAQALVDAERERILAIVDEEKAVAQASDKWPKHHGIAGNYMQSAYVNACANIAKAIKHSQHGGERER